MTWTFQHPLRLLWLLSLLAVLGAYLFGMQLRRRRAVRFSNAALLDTIAPTHRSWGRHVVAGCQLLGLAIALMGLAQPIAEVRVPRDRATVMLALDTSLSMQATDVAPSRIEAAKKAGIAFVRSLPEAINVGLVSFDGTSRVEVTPTTDRSAVVAAIKGLELHEGTAIGDAVETSINAIQRMPTDANGKRAPGVIVLLSDGTTTMGLPTGDAEPLAQKAGIPVSTIAYGTADGVVDITNPQTGETQMVPVPVDSAALASLANKTGGTAYSAQSASDLSSVYEKLGSAIGYDTETQDVTWRYLAAAVALLIVTSTVSAAWFQRIT